MKKYLFAAVVCALCASCTKESYLDIENSQVETADVNKSFFDESETNFQIFWNACVSIIEVHKDFDYFLALLTEDQVKKIESKSYDVDDAVAIIYRWWENPNTFDVMCEWPDWDDFYVYLPEKYYEIYHFCW